MPDVKRLHYLFDPLCGWCYGAALAIAAVTAAFPDDLELMPAGLFADDVQVMTSRWAAFIWSHDQRIAATTGQTFSQAYHDRVVMQFGRPFTSVPATRALTLLSQVGQSEVEWLARLQHARFVEGQDTSDTPTVGALLADAVGEPVADVVQRLLSDEALARSTNARIRDARGLMDEHGISGVPALLVGTRGNMRQVGGAALYGESSRLIDAVQSVLDGINAEPGPVARN